HWIINALRATCLLLCLATVVLWIRSLWVTDHLTKTDWGVTEIVSFEGAISLTRMTFPAGRGPQSNPSAWAHSSFPRSDRTPFFLRGVRPERRNRFAGFEWTLAPMGSRSFVQDGNAFPFEVRVIAVPYWAIVLLLSALAAFWLWTLPNRLLG